MTTNKTGPIYGVKLIDTLPLGTGVMNQALPNRDDLEYVLKHSMRTVAGYEVLLSHYQQQLITIAQMGDKLSRVAKFGDKMSRSGCADRARAGNDVLELLAMLEFNPTTGDDGSGS